TFNVLKTGKYAILLAQSTLSDVPGNHWAKDYITKLTSRYYLSDVFTGINTAFAPENQVSGKEIILLYEKVTGRTSENLGLDIKQKSEKLGLDTIINSNALLKSIRRQEAAAVLIKLLAAKKGVGRTALKPGRTIILNDEAEVGNTFYSGVILAVDLNLMETDPDYNFKPLGYMTRADIAAAFVKLLELTGDI
ncbi:MAG: ferrous iron transporter A, partial [Ruminiclostridium sp.]|nr:ferrous iron transporter A [Ruminiclostridium sp.]